MDEFDRTCPNSLHLFPATVRQPLRNMVEDVCPRRSVKRRLSASQFQVFIYIKCIFFNKNLFKDQIFFLQANNLEHLKMLSDMGITTLTLTDGRVQLLHTFSNVICHIKHHKTLYLIYYYLILYMVHCIWYIIIIGYT